jgi:predicted O-methyltransferase YrrM
MPNPSAARRQEPAARLRDDCGQVTAVEADRLRPRGVTFALPWQQIRRALREPRRLTRLHYSSVLASLRSIVEPDDQRFVCDYFGVDVAQFRRLEEALLDDVEFRRSLEVAYRDVRGTSIRVLGKTSAADHERRYRLLYYCTRLQRPEVVVETGVFDGFSSAFILKALRDNQRGRLCSIDLPARTVVRASTDKMSFDRLPTGQDPGWIVPASLRPRWTLRLGASQRLLGPWLAELGTIDLFFHDSLHTRAHMAWEYSVAWPALSEGGVLSSDDVFWSRAFWNFTSEIAVRGRVVRGMGFVRKPPRSGAAERVLTPPLGAPEFSVIVPVAPGREPLVLQSLREFPLASGRCEVLTQVGPNPSRNRNQRIDHARAPLLAFTDDDCRVASDWLARAAAFFRAHPDYDVVGGPQLNTADERLVGRASGYALGSWFGTFRHYRRYKRAPPRLDATQNDLTSANLFITRRAFDTWGPFDERLWPNEETALLRKIELAGGKIAYDPSIVVFHRRRGSVWQLARQCAGYGRGRARQLRIEGAFLSSIEQTVPALFLLYVMLLPLFVSVSPATLVPLLVYGTAGVLVSVETAIRRRDLPAALVMPFVLFAIHTSYPAGFLAESVRILLRRDRQ